MPDLDRAALRAALAESRRRIAGLTGDAKEIADAAVVPVLTIADALLAALDVAERERDEARQEAATVILPVDAYSKVHDLTEERDTLRAERDRLRGIVAELEDRDEAERIEHERWHTQRAEAEVARFRGALERITESGWAVVRDNPIYREGRCPYCFTSERERHESKCPVEIARAALAPTADAVTDPVTPQRPSK